MLRKIILSVFILIALLVVVVIGAALLIDPDDYRDELAARASQQLGREVRLEGPMELKFFPWLALDIQDVSVGNPPGFEQAPALAGIERATASVRVLPLLRGEVEVGTVTIERAGLHIVTARDGTTNLEGLFPASQAEPASGEPADLSQIRTGAVRFETVVLSLIDLAAGTRTEVRLDRLDLGAFAAGSDVPLSFEGRLVQNGETAVGMSFDGRLRVAADLAEVSLSDWSLDYDLPTAGARGEASGSLTVNPSAQPLRIELAEFDNRIDAAGFTVGLAAGQPITATLGDVIRVGLPAARLELDGQALDLEGEARLGDTIGGRLSVTGERLDLTRLAPQGGPEDAAGGDAGAGEPAEDFSALEMFDLEFSLDLDELILTEGARLTEVSARSALRGGELVLDPLSARLFGGSFDGAARVDFRQQPPAVVLSPELSGVRVAELVTLVTGRSPVDGQGAFRMNLSFSGFSPQQMLGSLDGSGNFSVAEGVLEGVDLEALIEQELTTSNLAAISRSFGGQTRFRTLEGGMRIEDGVVELPNMNLSAAGYGATGQGRIDLGAGRVDYALALDLGEELTQKLPEALRRATGGTIPLSISGEIARPTVNVDLAAIAQGAVREELGRRLLEALGEEEEETPPSEAAGEPSTEGEQAQGEASREDRRRDSARNLLRGLLESRDEAPEDEATEPAEATEEESESDPPPTGG